MALNKILSGIVEDFCEKNMLSDLDECKAYEYIVNYATISKYHPDAFGDPQSISAIDVDTTGSMFGLDCIAFIVNDNLIISKADIEIYAKSKSLDIKIIFIQSKIEEKYKSGDILKTIDAVKSFFGDRSLLAHNEEMANACEIYDELCQYKNSRLFNSYSPECYVFFVTAARPCEENLIKNICLKAEKDIMSLFPDVKKVEIQALGSDYVIDSYKEVENRVEVCINFKNNLSLDKIDRVEQSYLGYLAGEELLKVIVDNQGRLRRRLFYENVRDYQGNNPVNNEIRSTLSTEHLRDKFLLLNNGITIVARHFKSLGSNQFEMTDFQIVNGCQTSNEIYLKKELIKDVLVPVKIIHTTDSELISMIVRASNRQTSVPDEAFIALEEYHKRLQEIFDIYSRDMPIKIYYERRSGEFDFLENRPQRYQMVNLHGLIRAVTAAYYKNAYVVYNNNPANILRNRSGLLFQKTHVHELYYTSNYLLAQFDYLNFKKHFGRDEHKLRFYIPMVARALLAKSNKIPDFSSKDMMKESQFVISILKNDEREVNRIFAQSVQLVRDEITQFKHNNPSVHLMDMLRSQKFNQLVDSRINTILPK